MSNEAHGAVGTAPGYVQAATGDLQPGFVVGEYRIEGVAGRGGMGVVYAAVQPVIEKKVAIKVLNAQLSADHDLVRRFVDEARAVNRIGHENIIDIFSFGQLSDGRQYFVMEYLEGATLAARLDHGDLAATDFPLILVQICEALDAAHAKKIVHRDLKPENVWIGTSTRGQPRVRLLDFGIAKLLEVGERTVTDVGAVMGTPHFMSHEQCNGRGVDHRTDIYALGALMYRLFTGRLPIQGQTYAEILAKQITETPPAPSTLATLPAALDRLIVSCLQKDPNARPQSAAALGASIATIFGLTGLGSGPVSAAQRANAGFATIPVLASAPTSVAAAAATTYPPRRGTHDPLPEVVAAAPQRRSPLLPVAIGLAVVVALGAAWLALRPSGRGSEPSAAPAVARPTQPAAVAPAGVPAPVPPPPSPEATRAEAQPAAPPPISKAGPEARTGARTLRAVGKREGGPRPEPKPPTPMAPAAAAVRRPHEKATSTGLVTDNPFQ